MYFLPYVLIIKEEDKKSFRLVVSVDNKILFDERYRTSRGARIAFSKYFNNYRYSDQIKSQWSHFYCPQETWLQNILECKKKRLRCKQNPSGNQQEEPS